MKAKFKKGELVKAFFKTAGPDAKQQPEWHLATYLGKYGNHKVSCRHGTFTTNRVKKWEPLNDLDLEQHAHNHFEELLDLTNKAVKALLPSAYKVKRSDSENYTVEIGENNISISPAIIEITTLNSFKEVPGWAVTTWKYYPGSRLDPPDYVDSEVGMERTIERVVALAIRTAWELDSDAFWRSVAEDHLAEEG